MDQDEGISVYKKEVPGSDVLAFRGEGVVDVPLSLVASVIFDTTRSKEWMEDLEESRILKWNSPGEFIEYDHIGTPFVMKDREFVSKVEMTVDKEKHEMRFFYHSADDPLAPKTSYVRGDLKNSIFVLTSVEGDAKTHVEAEIHCDPMGSVAKWIVNFFQKSWPMTTFKSLRKQVHKSDVKIDPRFAEIFTRGIIFPK